MTLLVVGNHQAVNERMIPWEDLEGVMLVRCVVGGVFDLKHKLEVFTQLHDLPKPIVVFAIPPDEVVPPELLRGFGLRVSDEVILYDECVATTRSKCQEENKDTRDH